MASSIRRRAPHKFKHEAFPIDVKMNVVETMLRKGFYQNRLSQKSFAKIVKKYHRNARSYSDSQICGIISHITESFKYLKPICAIDNGNYTDLRAEYRASVREKPVIQTDTKELILSLMVERSYYSRYTNPAVIVEEVFRRRKAHRCSRKQLTQFMYRIKESFMNKELQCDLLETETELYDELRKDFALGHTYTEIPPRTRLQAQHRREIKRLVSLKNRIKKKMNTYDKMYQRDAAKKKQRRRGAR